jgi:thioredoxin-related protein
MNAIENLFLDIGLSWTMSKIIPYILSLLIGILFVYLFRKTYRKAKKPLRWLLSIAIVVISFTTYFLYAPIYEGDFSNNSTEVEKTEELAELTGKKLIVISIPGCPYCYDAIDKMLILKNRVPTAEIEYVVCGTTDSLALEWYKEKGGDAINVRLSENSEALSKLAGGSFPAFVIVDNNKILTKWSNDSFGVSALDEVELSLN